MTAFRFGIDKSKRQDVLTAKRQDGFTAEDIEYQTLNQLLFEVQQDYIIGTAVQLTAGACNYKYQSSDQTLRDASAALFTPSDGDRLYIIGLDTLTNDFDLSANDRLEVTVDSGISLDNSSFDLVFGDDCALDLHCDSVTGIANGTGCSIKINNVITDDVILADTINEKTADVGVTIDSLLIKDANIVMPSGKGIDFSADSKGVFKGLESVIYRLNTDITNSLATVGSAGGQWDLANTIESEDFLGASGTGLVAETNGIFQLQTTGYFLILFTMSVDAVSSNTLSQTLLELSNDVGVTDTYTSVASMWYEASATNRGSTTGMALIKVATAALNAFKLAFTAGGAASTIRTLAHNATYITVLKLADI